MITLIAGAVVCLVLLTLLFVSVQVVRPVERRLVERFGKYRHTLEPGLSMVIPFIDNVYSINVTETMADVEPQVVITKDKLNVTVDAIVYYKVNNPQNAKYNVDDYEYQLIALAKTTLRSVVGKMTLTDANEKRDAINGEIEGVLDKELKEYGVDVLRVEIQKFEPPKDVIEAMNNVVKAEQAKIAAEQMAKAAEQEADGFRMAAIKKAEGVSKSNQLEAEGKKIADILIAEGQSKAITLINEAIGKTFNNEARMFKQLEVAQVVLANNTKIIVPEKSNLVNLLGNLMGMEK